MSVDHGAILRYLSQELTRLQFRRKRKGIGDKSEGGCAEWKREPGEGCGKGKEAVSQK